MTNKLLQLSFLILTFCSCADTKKTSTEHEVRFIQVSPDTRLEVLNWGGEGQAILFLAGLGNSEHVFDEFAPRFADKFQVYALTRRGFGASSQPQSGYDLATLTRDIITVLDSLAIQKVVLAGHSIAGEEMTKLAALHPDRIDRLVYLDAPMIERN